MIRKILIALALLTFGWAIASEASAQAHWRNYGADPAYASKEAAKADAAAVFRRAGWPPEAITAMVNEMRSTPAERITLRNGDRLDFMRTGPSGLWRNVLVDFVSHGRGVEVIVHADRWQVTVDGVQYEAIIPDVCNNLAGRRKPPPVIDCVYHDVEVREESTLIWARYDTATDKCFAYRSVDRVFQPDSAGDRWNPIEPGCIGRPCDLTQVNQALGRQNVSQGELRLQPGRYQVRLQRNEFMIYCEKIVNGTSVLSSFATGVRWQQDYRQVGSQWHARIYYESNQLRADGKELNAPGGLALWASNVQDEALMRGLARSVSGAH